MLLACEPLYLLYCKDNKVSADNSNELTIFASPSVEPLSQEFKYVFPKEIPHWWPPHHLCPENYSQLTTSIKLSCIPF